MRPKHALNANMKKKINKAVNPSVLLMCLSLSCLLVVLVCLLSMYVAFILVS